jgi:hypothetical protein
VKNLMRTYWLSILIVCGAGPFVAAAAGMISEPVIGMAPAYKTVLRTSYGESEEPVLRMIVGARVSAALRTRDCGLASRLEITLLDARPTHPTDKQIDDNAAIDRLRTHFAGGASFGARLLAADGSELKSLRYDWYAENDHFGSKAAEPWGDVRLASEGLGAELAGACTKLSHDAGAIP